MRIAIAGKNAIAVDFFHFVLGRVPAEDLMVVPNRDDAARTTWQPSLRRAAAKAGVRVATLEEAEAEADAFLSCEFDRIVRPAKFRTKRLFNIHFSLLPKYRGIATSVWPLLHDDREGGVTLHWIDPGIDTGDVIAQRSYPIGPETTARDIYMQNMVAGLELLSSHFEEMVRGEPRNLRQPSVGASYFGRKHIDWQNAHRVDLSQTAWQISRHLRAYSFFEYQLPRVDGVAIGAVELTNTPATAKAGTIVERTSDRLVVAAIDVNVVLHFEPRMRVLDALERNELSILSDASVDVNFRGPKGWSPLHIAAFKGNVEAVEALLARTDIDVNFTNHRGTTPLMYARSCADRGAAEKIVRSLLRVGARLDLVDEDGRTVKQYAEADGQADFLSWVG